ncbi:flagellar assembly protein FliW [Fluviispira multicolorata]|uniref:Flagellar assembly factor FliW n=1 Tax=Fluviispira multicolorata TaxID=2654512 RepID=A0A833JBW7_9BACT|nr:flagellar assembly protein FliW [Fluviispira multicolorata]KAB8029848.1 flagellar assembly protein FliW [Fluviispira multicolorata]
MKINTSRFGEIEVNESDLLNLPDGLIGFPELNQFILLDHDVDSPFKWLQSINDPAMAFIIISPLSFRPDYMVEVTEEEVAALKLTNPDEAVISVIVTIPMDPKKMSANLKAPLVFNLSNKLGKQVILKDPQYQTKHFIMEEMKRFSQRDSQNDLKKAIQQQLANKVESEVSSKR